MDFVAQDVQGQYLDSMIRQIIIDINASIYAKDTKSSIFLVYLTN